MDKIGYPENFGHRMAPVKLQETLKIVLKNVHGFEGEIWEPERKVSAKQMQKMVAV